MNDEVVNLDKQIKRNARADRKQHLVNQFQHNPADPHRKQLWKAVNHLKRDYKPSYISMRDSCGRLVPLQDSLGAETIASYLEQKQWSNTLGQAPLPSCRKIGDDPDSNSAPFSMQELNDVLKGCKLGKQPGPDCIRMELYKWLNPANRQTLLNILNDWWAHGDIPTISRQKHCRFYSTSSDTLRVIHTICKWYPLRHLLAPKEFQMEKRKHLQLFVLPEGMVGMAKLE